MALTKCPDCGKARSSKSYYCPNCGRTTGELFSYRTKVIIALTICIVAIVLAVMNYANAPR